MQFIRRQLDKNKDITDARDLKVLQNREYYVWADDERAKFIEAVKKYGKNSLLVSKHIGTKDEK